MNLQEENVDSSDDAINLDEDVDVSSGGESKGVHVSSGGESEEVYFSYMPSDYSEETEERDRTADGAMDSEGEGPTDGAMDSEGKVEQEEDGKLTDVDNLDSDKQDSDYQVSEEEDDTDS